MDSPIEELSADEIVAMVVEATREVHSLLRESRATVEWRTYERSTSVVWMHVAGDYYSSWTFPESADSPLEMLVYRGNVWKRDDAGGWVSDKPPSDRPVDTHSTDLSRSSIRDDQRMALVVGVDFEEQVSDLERLSDERHGDGLVRLHGRYATWTSFPAASLWPDRLGPDEIDPLIDLEAVGTVDIWIDLDTFCVVRTEAVLRPTRAYLGSDTKTDAVLRIITTFSQFNEAELPGPLPK